MIKISVYINHRASGAQFSEWENGLRSQFFRYFLIFKRPKSIEELEREIIHDIKTGVDYIFSVGGDGTINLMIQKLVGTDVKLFVIPSGTANDLASYLGLTSNIRKIAKIFRGRSFRQFDLIKVNNRYMSTNGGVGLAASVAKVVNRYRRIWGMKWLMHFFGKRVYSFVLVVKVLTSPLKKFKIRIDSKEFSSSEITVSMFFFNNQPTLAGSFLVAPETNNADGTFNVSFYTHESKFDLVRTILKVKLGMNPKEDSKVITFETRKIMIESLNQKPMLFFGDGEVFFKTTYLDAEITPLALTCCSVESESIFDYDSYDLSVVEKI